MDNKTTRKFATLFFVVLISVSVCFAQDSNQDEQKNESQDTPQELTVIEYDRSFDLNPHTSSFSNEAQILNSVYEGLFSYNQLTLEPEKALATDFHVSRNKKNWSFTIREGTFFSNNKPITAESIKESWLNLIATKDATYSSFLDIIQGAKEYRTGNGKREDVAIFTDDSNHLNVTLTKPASHFPKILCHHAFSAVDPDGGASGAYYIESVSKESIVLKKNDKYWDAATVSIPKITILLSNDSDENTYAFNLGEAQWVPGPFNAGKIINKSYINLAAEFGTEYLFFKSNKSPWSNPNFRLALLTAAPWEELRRIHTSKAETLIHPLTGYKSPEGFSYTNEAEAKVLLNEARKEAGYAEDEKLTLKFAIMDNDYMKIMAQALKEAWAKINVEVEIIEIPNELYLQSISSTEADLFTYTWIGDFADPLAFLELFRSDSAMNETEWRNKDYDDLLDKACFTNDASEHYDYLSKAEDLLLSSGLIMPISHPIAVNLVDTTVVKGFTNNALDIHPYKYMRINTDTHIDLPNVVKK